MPRTVTEYDDDELGLQDGWDDGLDPNIRREIRQARIVRRERDEAQTARDAAERELTLYRAGIPGDQKGQAFAKIYEGDRSNPEAIKSAYEELFGPLSGETPAGTGNPADGADGKIAKAGNEGGGTGATGPIDLAEAIRSAKTEEEVMDLVRYAQENLPDAHLSIAED